jgi:hypothetical protein
MRGLSFASALVLAASLFATHTDYLSAKQKFQSIEKHKVASGARVPITSEELNSYVRAELPKVAPEGIRQPVVELPGNNRATGRAMIDFVKLRSAQGKPPGWLLRNLLQGEHEVMVTTTVQSGGGSAVVNVERVEVSGVPISGSALDYLIENYVIPKYPDVKIGKPFQLKYGMDRLEVAKNVAYVVMK